MIRIFLGYDKRQAITYNVARFSIERRSSVPVSITPLIIDQLPLKRKGLTDFSFSRFLVPYLCEFKGTAIFLDADILCLEDIEKMSAWVKSDGEWAVAVRKSPHRFEWASVMKFNCEHPANRILTPEYIETAQGLHGLNWVDDSLIAELSHNWNHLVGYDEPQSGMSLIHFTQGIPVFQETEGSEYKAEWMAEAKAMNTVSPWLEIMGRSVHAAPTKDGRLVAKLHKDSVNAP